MTDGNRPVYTRRHWGKADRQEQDTRRVHLLEHHLADVAACFEALLEQPTIRRRLARTAGLDDLDAVTVARLCVLVALHDIGKVNVGFQTRIWGSDSLRGHRKVAHTGHTLDLTPVLNGDDSATADWFFPALGWPELLAWDDCGGETVCALFIAALSHHGLPLDLEACQCNPSIWRPLGELDPQQCVEKIARMARDWFPAAFSQDGPPLPSAPAFQHAYLGLCTLADWIGSDEGRFPFHDAPQKDYFEVARARAGRAVRAIGLDIGGQREAFRGAPEFGRLFNLDGATPNAIQRQAVLETALDERLVIIESETGSGKTEAALWRFARMYEAGLIDGIYFGLPTRAAASQMYERVKRFVANLFPDGEAPEPVLAVPGYLRAGDAGGKLLHDYRVWWEDDPSDVTRSRRWAAENAKRYLAAQIAVGTVDQAMMAALRVKHSHMRAACLSRNLLVVDEVHASDPYMGAVLEALLEAHCGAGGYALLMSATLGSAARRRWLLGRRRSSAEVGPLDSAVRAPYPAVSMVSRDGEKIAAAGENAQRKTVQIESAAGVNETPRIADRALGAARAGAKVLIIRNTVKLAVRTQQALEERAAADARALLFTLNDVSTLHHGRFAAGDRRLLDKRVEELLGKSRASGGRIVVGTQTLEQSLDIDADLLITDLCPVDVLLQRIGRLHRHDRSDRPAPHDAATCVVLSPEGGDLSPLLVSRQDDNGLGPYGYVYPDLRVLEATRRLVEGQPVWRIPEMNRELVERCTHPAALKAIVNEMGEEWIAHAGEIAGGRLADDLTARSAVVRRGKTFLLDNSDILFGSVEEKIRTRLGDEGIKVEFEPRPPSPFRPGAAIAELTVPAHMGGGPGSEEAIRPEPVEGGFVFAVGGREFTYDRLGLRRL